MTGNQKPVSGGQSGEPVDIEFALKAARLGVWELDPVTNVVNWDDRCRALFGLATHNRIPYQDAIRFIHPDDADRVDRAVRQAMNPAFGGDYDVTYRTLGADDGLLRWVRFIGQGYFDESGGVYRFAGVAQDVTQAEQTRQRTQEDATRFKYMADHASDPFILMQQDGTFAYLNQLALDRWGYTADEATRLRVPDVDLIYSDPVFSAVFARAQTEKIPPFETIHRRKDGTVYPVEVNMGGMMLGDKPYLFAVARDLAERKKAGQALRDSESLFRNVTNSAPTGLWLSDPAGGLTYLNHTLVEWTGLPYENLLGSGWASAIIDEDRPRSADAFLTAVATRAHYDVRFRIRKKDGSVIWCQAAGDPYYLDDGSYGGYAGFCMDIDELVKGREAVQRSEAKLRSLIANAPASIGLYVGRDFIIDTPNQMFIDIMGKGPDIVGKPLREVMPELKGQPFLQILDDVYTSGQLYHSIGSEVAIVRQGTLVRNFYNITYTPLFDAAGAVYAILEVAIDVTEEINARQSLEVAEKTLRGAIELAELATWSLNIGTGTFSYSPRFMNWLGFSEDTKGLDDAYDPLPDDVRQSVVESIAAAIRPGSSGLYENEHPIIHRLTGRLRIIHAQAQVFYETDGTPARLSGTARDVTRQRELQLSLEQQVQERTEELAAINEQMAATNEEMAATNEELIESNELLMRSNDNLQRFAYVASHDLQEPLRKIHQFGDLLKNQYGPELGDGVQYLERMQLAASRMSALIRDLLTFSRISTQQDAIAPVPLTELVHTILLDLDMRIQETGAMIDVGALPTVPGDPSQLGQLFQNLMSNALKFRRPDPLAGGEQVQAGGEQSLLPPTIRINAQRVDAARLPPSVKPTRAARQYYRIDVVDDGIGFENKYVDRIFQVFQRLHGKSAYAGTGIGLAICAKVAANHGGAITATSEPGQGATFSVYLPC